MNFGHWTASQGEPSKEAEMPRKGHREGQIVFALKQPESWATIPDICRTLGISDQTFYRWKHL